MWYVVIRESPAEAAETGRAMARGRTLSQFQEEFPDEASCAAFFFGASLVQRLCLPRLWRATVGGAQESRLHLRVPRLWSANVSHFGNGDASFQAATDGMVLGCASHVDSFERDVGASVGRPTRRHI